MANETFDSVWDAIADSPEEAAAFKAEGNLIKQIVKLAEQHGEDLEQLGMKCGIPKKRIKYITHGRITKVDFFDLCKLAAALGYRIQLVLKE